MPKPRIALLTALQYKISVSNYIKGFGATFYIVPHSKAQDLNGLDILHEIKKAVVYHGHRTVPRPWLARVEKNEDCLRPGRPWMARKVMEGDKCN